MICICPMDLKGANAFVSRYHRHHKPTPGAKFSIGITDGEVLRGVAIVGRPVSRMIDDGWTVEVNRCCTDGVRNGCSMLYGACRRTAMSLGYRRIVTYTLPEEGGASLKASGWTLVGESPGGSWSCPSRHREDSHPLGTKLRWECILRTDGCEFDWRQKTETNTEQLTFGFGEEK